MLSLSANDVKINAAEKFETNSDELFKNVYHSNFNIIEGITNELNNFSFVIMVSLNKSWKQLFDNDFKIKTRMLFVKCFAEARLAAQKAPHGYHEKALYEIFKLEAPYSYLDARITAETFKNPIYKNLTLLEINEFDFNNLATFYEVIKTCTDYNVQAIALCTIARVDPRHDFTIAKKVAADNKTKSLKDYILCRIAVEEAQYDLASAKETAHTIEISLKRDEALLEIVKIEVRDKLVEAKTTAQFIVDSYFKVQALLEIAIVDPQHDLTEIVEIFKKIGNNDKRILATIKMFKIDSQSNLKERIKNNLIAIIRTIEAVKDIECKAEMLIEVAKIAPEELIRARKAVSAVSDELKKVRMLIEIAKIDSQYNFTEAKNVAKKLDLHIKHIGLFEIAKAEFDHLVKDLALVNQREMKSILQMYSPLEENIL